MDRPISGRDFSISSSVDSLWKNRFRAVEFCFFGLDFVPAEALRATQRKPTISPLGGKLSKESVRGVFPGNALRATQRNFTAFSLYFTDQFSRFPLKFHCFFSLFFTDQFCKFSLTNLGGCFEGLYGEVVWLIISTATSTTTTRTHTRTHAHTHTHT